MKAFSPNEIRLAVHGRWLSQGADITVDGVTIDSRTADPGDLFVAIKGENFDGHDFLLAAAKAGCISAIVDRDADLSPDILSIYGGGLIGVEDTTVALGELAGFYRKQIAANIIAITGSNGKTTVKEMIEHILSRRFTGTVGPKSFNNAIGVPLTLLAAKPSDDYVICEIGTNAPGEVLNLGNGIEYRIADVARLIVELVGRPVRLNLGALPYRPAEVMHFYSLPTKAMELLRWQPRVDLRQGLIQTIEWYKQQRLVGHD